jgi:hypothetical protein
MQMCNKSAYGRPVEHLSRTLEAHQCVMKIEASIVINLVTHKAAAECELWFNKPSLETGLLSKD